MASRAVGSDIISPEKMLKSSMFAAIATAERSWNASAMFYMSFSDMPPASCSIPPVSNRRFTSGEKS